VLTKISRIKDLVDLQATIIILSTLMLFGKLFVGHCSVLFVGHCSVLFVGHCSVLFVGHCSVLLCLLFVSRVCLSERLTVSYVMRTSK